MTEHPEFRDQKEQSNSNTPISRKGRESQGLRGGSVSITSECMTLNNREQSTQIMFLKCLLRIGTLETINFPRGLPEMWWNRKAGTGFMN